SVRAVKDLNMVIEDKKVVCLLGPSGCGKTTTMRIIAGLESPTTGNVFFDGQDVTPLGARERDVAMVFQFPTVYPHLSVYDNLSLPLQGRKLARNVLQQKIDLVIEQLGIPTEALGKKSGSIDPGLRQKVAIGRAIIREPKVFLFDEPLTNLDATARIELMSLIKHLSKEVGQTFVYVTHDQSEAMSLADAIAVMKDGELLQYEDSDTIYEFPQTTFVGWFLGNPGMNFISCQLKTEGTKVFLEFGSHRLGISSSWKKLLADEVSSEVILGIRPEYVTMSFHETQECPVRGLCSFVEFVGGREIFHIHLGEGIEIRVKDFPRGDVQSDMEVFIGFPEDKIRFFSPGGRLLYKKD
ncbi:MAG: ABC transporter ATP-binding protein, partial [Candidatus Caldatribacteriaceae bacterium]